MKTKYAAGSPTIGKVMIRQNKKLENVEYINVLWKLKSYSTKEEIYNKKYVGMPQNHINGRTKYK